MVPSGSRAARLARCWISLAGESCRGLAGPIRANNDGERSVSLFGAADFCGKIAMAVAIASPRIIWRPVAIERIADSTLWRFGDGYFRP